MKPLGHLLVAAGFLMGVAAWAQEGYNPSDPIGLNALRALDPTLTGSGVIVAQPEANTGGTGADAFEVNPADVGQSTSKFVFISGSGSSTSFPNTAGTESGHADEVGDIFYGDVNTADPEGVAPGVKKIYNYDADYFWDSIVARGVRIPARIVNQSFIDSDGDASEQISDDQTFDNYAATYNTLFISGVGDGGGVYAPASAYNGIAVAAYGGATSVGPAFDGRSKPDITAPGSATSFTTPLVSGAAAILLQAATRGDAGPGTENDAEDARTLKVLLLNGAVKPADWTHTDTAPLDPNYGAGILNIYNSYLNLKAGEAAVSGSASGAIQSMSGSKYTPDEGWDLASITTLTGTSGAYVNETNYYEFDLTAATAPAFTLTSTLTWDRQADQADINNLDLYLFDADTGAMVAVSDSTIDNVEELYVQDLPPGDYDIAVVKDGGTSINDGGTVVSGTETYAIAFNFAALPEPSPFFLLAAAAPVFWLLRRKT